MGTDQSYATLVITAKERPTDRYVQAMVEHVGAEAERQLFFGVCEVANRWQAASEIIQGLNQTFIRAFNQSRAKSPLTKFEDGLKNVNQFLEFHSERLAEPIDCILALVSGQQLYFSTINKGVLLLRRGGTISQITSQEAGSRFASVTSGDLQPKDWLIAPSQTLRTLLQPGELGNWPAEPTETLIRSLIEPLSRAERLTVAGVWLFTGDHSTVIDPVQAPARLPMALTALTGFSAFVSQQRQRWLKRPAATRPSRPVTDAPEPTRNADQPADAAPAAPRRRSLPYRRLLVPLIFLVLLAIGILLISQQIHRLAAKPPPVSTPTIANLIAKTPASQLFAFIDQNLTTDNYTALSAKQKTAFTQTLQKNNLSLVTPQATVTTLTNPVVAMDTTADGLFMVDSTGQLWEYQTSLTKLSQQSLVTNPVSLIALTDKKLLVSDQAGAIWLFDGSASQPTSLALPTNIAQGPKLLAKVSSTNVYIYQSATNTIYKVGGFQDAIGQPASVVTSDVLNFGSLTAWAIPSQFVGALSNGQIKTFSRSKVEPNPTIQYYSDSNPLALIASDNNSHLTIARGKYVTVYNAASGTKISEQVLVTTDPITALAAAPDQKTWVTAGRTLYRF